MRDRSRVIIVQDGCVALMKRVRDGRTYFVFPGGGVETGETSEEAAVREAREELGVTVLVLRLVAVDQWRDRHEYFYRAEIVAGQFGTGAGPEYQGQGYWGSYQPVWVEISRLAELDLRPPELGAALAEGSLVGRSEPLRLHSPHDSYFKDLHLPEDLRVFTIPSRGVRRWDEEVFVYDVRVGPDAILRHYSFANRWFEVNCNLNLAGQFSTEPFEAFDWAFNCDICTPFFTRGADLVSVDLCLDVLVAADGRTNLVKDEADFARAIQQGWIDAVEAKGARRGLADLLAILQGDGLAAFLDSVYPFGPVEDAPPALPMARRPLVSEPLLQPDERRRHR